MNVHMLSLGRRNDAGLGSEKRKNTFLFWVLSHFVHHTLPWKSLLFENVCMWGISLGFRYESFLGIAFPIMVINTDQNRGGLRCKNWNGLCDID